MKEPFSTSTLAVKLPRPGRRGEGECQVAQGSGA